MNICDECHQSQDDPQYSYHEAWCSQSPAVKIVLTQDQVDAAERFADQLATDLGWTWPKKLTD